MPKNTHTREVNKTINTIIDVECGDCQRSTKHLVLASLNTQGEDWYGENSVRYWSEHQIIMCQGCEEIGFRSATENSEDWDFLEDGTVAYNRTVSLYPRRAARAPLRDAHLLPESVERIYEETLQALNNGQRVLVGIGLRAIVESVCKEQNSIEGGLFQRIEGLVTQGALSPGSAKILHQIRALGNEAAHEVKPHSSEQLGVAFDVCEHLLQDVYILPLHAKSAFT